MREGTYSIMVIDDHPIIHDGLRLLLDTEDDLKIVQSASTSHEALAALETLTPDLIIVDLSLSDSDGTYLVQKIRSKYPKLRILVYTMSEENLFAERTASAGANGYIMKTNPPVLLKKAIRTVISGKPYFSEPILDRILKKEAGRSAGPISMLDTLSNREMDVFRLIGEGMDKKGISKKLSISPNTVDTHRINIKNKLDLQNGKALERTAFEIFKQNKLPR